MARILLIDVGSGNIRSAYSSLHRVWSEASCDGWVRVAAKNDRPQAIQWLDDCTHIVLPGVGAYADCMAGLQASELLDDMTHHVRTNGKAFLGICVGMQLLSDRGEEGTGARGLGWLGGITRQFVLPRHLKIPHMGWNEVTAMKNHVLWTGIDDTAHFYFVHSYYVECDESVRLASFDYGGSWTAAMGRDNLFATQFHPEKSQKAGLKMLKNFIAWNVG